MNQFFQGAIASIISALVRTFDAERTRRVLDGWLDALEKEIDKSENKVDDAVVVPLLNTLRTLLSIQENPGTDYEDKK